MTAVVVALAATPVAAEAHANCKYQDTYVGLFCVDGSQIYVCEDSGGNCAVSCGKGFVPVGPCQGSTPN